MGDAGLGILCTVAVGLLWSGIGVFNSRVGRSGWSIPLYAAITSFFSVIILCAVSVRWDVLLAGQASRLPELVLVLVPTALVNLLAMSLLMVAMRRGHNGFTWTIGQSAMVIPFLASVLIWGDTVSMGRWGGLALTLGALALIGMGRDVGARSERVAGEGHGWLVLAFIGLVLNGIAQTCNTIPSRWEGWHDIANLRPLLAALAVFVVTATWAGVQRARPQRRLVATAFAASLLGVLSSVLLFRAMDLLGAAGLLAVTYPLAVGVCILGFSAYSAVALKERFGFRGLGATALGIAGIAALAG